MKNIILILLIFLQQANAATYYVKASGGTGSGLDDASAWSLAKLNTVNLLANDIILLKRGDVFYGTLSVKNGVTYTTYGTGVNPKITGLSLLSTWKQSSGSIYYASLDVPSLNVVTLDGIVKGMGRYPKTGYIKYTAHSGTSSITASTTLPFVPTGAEIVIRKIRQITDRQLITNVSGNVYSLSSGGSHGTVYFNNTNLEPSDGNGFFIQSHLSTLTQLGDWYYDNAANRVYMHFGTDTPAEHTVQVSSLQKNIDIDNKLDNVFQNIDFEGANAGVGGDPMNNIANIQFVDCNVTKQQNAFVSDNGCKGLSIIRGSIANVLNNGLMAGVSVQDVTVDGTKFNNIGYIAGAGGSGNGQQIGVWLAGDNLTVKNCSFTNMGFHGIVLYGNNTLIEKNLINNYGLVKDDCGGIYEFQFQGVKHTNKIIRNNTILNGIGAVAGAPLHEQYGQAAAIYLDANVSNVKVYNNTLAHGTWGGLMLIGAGSNNELTHNLAYNFSKGLLIYNFSGLPIRNTIITSNTFIAKTSTQSPLYLQMYANDNPSLYGTFNNNIYARPIDDNNTITINKEYPGGEGVINISLALWKSTYSQDVNSSKSLVTTDQANNFRFDFNCTNAESVVPLDKSYSNVSNTRYTSSIKLPAYSGSVLVVPTPPAAVLYKSIPGKVEAESFDAKQGTCNVSSGDSGGGLEIGCVAATNWLDYNVDVAAAGTYTFNARISGGGQIQLRTAQNIVLSTINISTTGSFSIWKTVSTTVTLNAGKQTLRVYASQSGWNLNWFEVVSAIGGRVSAEPTILVDRSLIVYPNPAHNIIQVQHSIAIDSGFIQLISIDGRKIKRQDLISGSTDTFIDIHLLDPGSYLLYYQNGSSQSVTRMVKQ